MIGCASTLVLIGKAWGCEPFGWLKPCKKPGFRGYAIEGPSYGWAATEADCGVVAVISMALTVGTFSDKFQ